MTVSPPGVDPAAERARVLIDAGRLEEAKGVLQTALAQEPDDGGKWCLFALCMVRLDQYDEALEAAGRAAALEPAEEWPHRLASIALCGKKDYPRAVTAARESVRRESDLWQTHAQLALALHELRDRSSLDEAWQAASYAVSLAPEEAETHFVMGVIAQERRQHDVAEQAYEKVLALDPGHAAAMNNLGLVQLRRGKIHAAAEGFTSSLRSDPRLEVARSNVESVGWRLMTFGYYIAFAGFWILRLLLGGETEEGMPFVFRAGFGVVLLAVWTVLGVRMVGRLPTAARQYLFGMPRRSLGFGVMTFGIAGCVLGSMFAAFTPPALAFYGLVVAGCAIFLSFVTSWVVTVGAWRRRKKEAS
ncbi:MAG: tetratricopeptide repeat protein [Streptosporangiales bacterium]|nr:tetratricopeptide repeat protein [Streptosporangiales bacterium]